MSLDDLRIKVYVSVRVRPGVAKSGNAREQMETEIIINMMKI